MVTYIVRFSSQLLLGKMNKMQPWPISSQQVFFWRNKQEASLMEEKYQQVNSSQHIGEPDCKQLLNTSPAKKGKAQLHFE